MELTFIPFDIKIALLMRNVYLCDLKYDILKKAHPVFLFALP